MPGTWNSSNGNYRFSENERTIEIDPRDPARGVRFLRSGQHGWRALSIEANPKHSSQPEEIYVRRKDLIVRYSQAENDQFGFQVDWRLLDVEPPFVIGLEVWISIQTRLLDTSPRIHLTSMGDSGWLGWTHRQLMPDSAEPFDNLPGDPNAAIGWDSDSGYHLWLIDPRDLRQIHWQNPVDQPIQRASLFGEFLEKGVIRRARMWLLTSDCNLSLAAIQEAYVKLSRSELPLTA